MPDPTVEHSPFPSYPYPKLPPAKGKKPYYWIVLAILAIAILAIGAWKLLGSNKPNAKPTPSTAQTQDIDKISAKDVPDATGTKTYDNGYLGVNLTYPDSWVATESDNKDSVRLESPSFSYQAAEKGRIAGNFRIYIRKGARTVDGKYIGRGVAIGPSEKLVYAKPTSGQRSDTNLSLFGLDTPDQFAFFLIAGNFQLNKGDTLGPDYGKEAETFIIAGGFSAPDLKDDLATNSVPITGQQSSNAYKQAIEILKSLRLQ